MTDDEIARRIARECGVIVALSLLGKKAKAQLFADHVLRVVYANRGSVERWLNTNRERVRQS